jgi:hypothetical protein
VRRDPFQRGNKVGIQPNGDWPEPWPTAILRLLLQLETLAVYFQFHRLTDGRQIIPGQLGPWVVKKPHEFPHACEFRNWAPRHLASHHPCRSDMGHPLSKMEDHQEPTPPHIATDD